jgi:hypothetical protein
MCNLNCDSVNPLLYFHRRVCNNNEDCMCQLWFFWVTLSFTESFKLQSMRGGASPCCIETPLNCITFHSFSTCVLRMWFLMKAVRWNIFRLTRKVLSLQTLQLNLHMQIQAVAVCLLIKKMNVLLNISHGKHLARSWYTFTEAFSVISLWTSGCCSMLK